MAVFSTKKADTIRVRLKTVGLLLIQHELEGTVSTGVVSEGRQCELDGIGRMENVTVEIGTDAVQQDLPCLADTTTISGSATIQTLARNSPIYR